MISVLNKHICWRKEWTNSLYLPSTQYAVLTYLVIDKKQHLLLSPNVKIRLVTKDPKSDFLFMRKRGHCRYYHFVWWLLTSAKTNMTTVPALSWDKRMIYGPLSKCKTCMHSNCWMTCTLSHTFTCIYALCTHTLLAVSDSRMLKLYI